MSTSIMRMAFSRMCTRSFSHSTFMRASEKLTNVTQNNGVLKITMNNPKKRNALSLQMLNTLIDDMTGTEEDPSLRVIVISAEGPVFSAGHDLKELMIPDMQREVFASCSHLMAVIRNSPVPIISAVKGLAAAAGCQLVAASDIAVCTEKSSFSTPGASFGLFCSTPGIALVRAVPRQMANMMLFTGDAIDAKQALSAGLVAKVSAEDKLDSDLEKIINSIKSKPRDVVALGKKFLYQQVEMDVASAYRLGEEIMVSNLDYYNAKEGLTSFAEKRKPKWEGF